MVAAAERLVEPSKLIFDGQSKNLNDADKSTLLGEMGLHEGSEVSAYYSITPSYTSTNFHNNSVSAIHHNRMPNAYPFSSGQDSDDCEVEDDQNAIDVRVLLSGDDARFSCLLDLCDVVRDEAILRKLWLLVGMAPTHSLVASAYENIVEECAKALDRVSDDDASVEVPSIDWQAFLFGGGQRGVNDDGSASRTCYMLQTLDFMLQPAKEASHGDAQAKADKFKKLFLRSGGFKAVLDLVLSKRTTAPTSTEAGQNTSPYIQRSSSATTLHVLHYLLFQGLDLLLVLFRGCLHVLLVVLQLGLKHSVSRHQLGHLLVGIV